jgi:hypothetical protein
MPNNRQWALLFWLAVAVVWIVRTPSLRSSVGGVLKTVLGGQLRYLLLGMAAWVAAEVWFFSQIGLWNAALTTDTIVWFFSAGLILFGKFPKAATEDDFLTKRFRAAIGVPVLIEAYTEVGVMPLPVELIFQPFALLVGGTLAYTDSSLAGEQMRSEEQRQQVRQMLGCLMVGISLSILGAATYRLAAGWADLDKAQILRQLTLPVWQTVPLIPYVYLVGVYSAYELAFIRMRFGGPQPGRFARFRNRALLFAHCHVRARRVGQFTTHPPSTQGLGTARTYRDARLALKHFEHRENGAR